MNWKDTLFAGLLVGVVQALLLLVLMFSNLLEVSGAVAIVLFLLISLASPLIVQAFLEERTAFTTDSKHLFAVSILTFIIPLLGAAFGAPNLGFKTIASLILLGGVGGLFWSLPFTIWSQFTSKDAAA